MRQLTLGDPRFDEAHDVIGVKPSDSTLGRHVAEVPAVDESADAFVGDARILGGPEEPGDFVEGQREAVDLDDMSAGSERWHGEVRCRNEMAWRGRPGGC